MTTQIIEANQGLITNEMQTIADFEICVAENVRKHTEEGEVVILKNNQREAQNYFGIGKGLGVKVCTAFNMASSNEELLDMFKIVKMAGAHSLLETSACDDIAEKREKLIASTALPYGTIPIHQSVYENLSKGKTISKLTKKKIISDIEAQVTAGVDFVVLNASLTSEILNNAKENNYDVYSDNAKLIAYWMEATEKENPYYEAYDEVLDILRTYDVALCLELSLKNTSVFDFMNKYQMQELVILGELTKKARNSGVQVFVDPIGVTSIDNFKYAVDMVKKITGNAPIFATNINVIDSENEKTFSSTSIANTLLAYCGADFIQSFKLPKTTGYFNAKLLKESIESALMSAKMADYAKNNSKAVEFEKKYFEEKKSQQKETHAELIKKIFS